MRSWGADRTLRATLLLVTIASTGCVGIQDTYAPPEQRKPLNVEDPSPLKPFVDMNDAGAPAQFIRDISPALEGGTWRWTQQRPTLMFSIPTGKGWKFAADFTISDLTFAQTGPVTMTITVNGQKLDETLYDKPGYKHFEKPVREDWLRAKAENIVTMEVDKVWVAPTDKATLGFVLTRCGFIR